MIIKPIILDFYDVGLANRLFQISFAISYLKRMNIQYDKIYFSNFIPPKEIFEILEYNGIKYGFIDEKELIWGAQKSAFQSAHINRIEDIIIFNGSCQYYDSIDEMYIQSTLKCPSKIKEEIYNKIPDIEDRVVCHVRRNDYLNDEWSNTMVSIDENYIKKVYKKYFDGNKLLFISDDVEWCKEKFKELSDDIYFSNERNIFDIYTLSFSKGNICSCSSFSIMGSILNTKPDKKIIVPYPYYKKESKRGKYGDLIVPNYCIRENYE